MSTLIWWILGGTTFVSLSKLLTLQANEDVARATAAAIKAKNQVRLNGCVAVLIVLVSAGIPVLWTAYSYDTHDWRFAAIAWVPVAVNLFLKAAIPSYGKAKTP